MWPQSGSSAFPCARWRTQSGTCHPATDRLPATRWNGTPRDIRPRTVSRYAGTAVSPDDGPGHGLQGGGRLIVQNAAGHPQTLRGRRDAALGQPGLRIALNALQLRLPFRGIERSDAAAHERIVQREIAFNAHDAFHQLGRMRSRQYGNRPAHAVPEQVTRPPHLLAQDAHHLGGLRRQAQLRLRRTRAVAQQVRGMNGDTGQPGGRLENAADRTVRES